MNIKSNQTKLGKILNSKKLNNITNDNIPVSIAINVGKKVVTSEKPHDEFIKTLSNLGDMIRYKRTKSKLSLKRTASLCGISDKTLRSIEKGENANTASLLVVINMLGLKLRLEE